MKLRKKLIAVLTVVTLVAASVFSSFCLAANSDKVMNKEVANSDYNNKYNDDVIENSKVIVKESKKSCSKAANENKKDEQSASQSNNSKSLGDAKCLVVQDSKTAEEIKKAYPDIKIESSN